jgi:hypothetical protein
VQETLLGYGSLMIQTYLGDIIIHDVHHPEKITNSLFEILREHGAVIDEAAGEAEKTSRNNH